MSLILDWLPVVSAVLSVASLVLHKLHKDAVANELDSLRKQLPGAQ